MSSIPADLFVAAAAAGAATDSPPAPPASTTSNTTATAPAATGSLWGWIEKAQVQAKELADKAQVRATDLLHQAQELKNNYDIQVAAEMLGGALGSATGHGATSSHVGEDEGEAEGQADVHYITENILSMSFPYTAEMHPRGLRVWNDIDKAASLLKEKHAGKYMIWNVSEDPYDYSVFDNQVLEYKFPGHPAPPLGLLFKICAAIESWLEADKNNVAVVHCLTGKGRTGAILACVLAWIGEFSSPLEALQYVAQRRECSIEDLTIPSQRRYIQYFSNVLDGVKPRPEPLLLRRVIINTIPRFGTMNVDGQAIEGCCPYLQIFKNGNLIANSFLPSKASKAGTPSNDGKMELKWINTSEGSISFHMDAVIHGDMLIRCRHIHPHRGVRDSMFRAALHTGYTPVGVMRLTKAQLDGCDTDDRFDDDFFVDFIFAPVEKRESTAKAEGEAAASAAAGGSGSGGMEVSDSGLILDSEVASKFDEMLHKDGRFWDKIAMRKNRAMDGRKKQGRKIVKSANDVFSIDGESSPTASAKAAAPAVLDVLSSTPPKRSSDLANMELIMQLAQAEGEDLSKTSSSGNGAGAAANSSNIADIDRLLAEPPLKTTPATSAGSSSVDDIITSAQNELDALEDFERELGLSSSSSTTGAAAGVASSSSGAGATAGAASADDSFEENLDELEKYLQSLGNS